MTNYIKFQLDETGNNVNNLVVNEQHNIGTKTVRIISTNYGPFYLNNLLLKDMATGNQLAIGTDYYVTEMLQEATIKYGKEIYLLIVIPNESIGTEVSVTYQVLGGLYQKDAAYLKNVYDSVTNNTSPISWANVVNKPIGFNPSDHNHLLNQTFGYEVFNIGVERITKALQVMGLPAFESLLEFFTTNINEINAKIIPITSREVSDIIPSDKLVSFNRLLQAAKELNFNTITITPNVADFRSGGNKLIQVNTTNMIDGETLFWSIEHINTINEDFVSINGSIPIYNSKGMFNIQIPSLSVDSGSGVKIKLDINGDYYSNDQTYFNSSVGDGEQKFLITDGNAIIDTFITKIDKNTTYDERITFTDKIIQLNKMFGFNIVNGQPNDSFYYIIPNRQASPMLQLDGSGSFSSPINLFFPLDSGSENQEIVFVFAGTLHRKSVRVKILNSGDSHPVISMYPSVMKSGTKQSLSIIGGKPNEYYYIKPVVANKKFRYFRINIRRTDVNGNIVASSGVMTIDSEDGIDVVDIMTKCCFGQPDVDISSPITYYIIKNKRNRIKSLDEVLQ